MKKDTKWTKISIVVVFWIVIIVSLLNIKGVNDTEVATDQDVKHTNMEEKTETQTEVIPEHQGLNEEPVPLGITRSGSDVFIKMTAQITDIEIKDGQKYKAWTFNGEAPGPLVVVNQGDTIHFTLENHDPAINHSMDFHAVHAAPDKAFTDIKPNEEGTFVYEASNPGVFMYHCGTGPALLHIANGMHGMIIVKPNDGYPTDDEVDREYVVIQNEWYKYNDLEDMTYGQSGQVVLSTKALHEDQLNTNGTAGALLDQPLQAKAGEKVRFYVLNVGPNETSSFHVIGSQFDDVYVDGNPANHYIGMQTVLLPASGGAVVEFTLKEAGEYKFVSHQFDQVEKGAAGKIIAYDGEIPEQQDEKQTETNQQGKTDKTAKSEAKNQLNIKAKNYVFDKDEYVVKAGEEVTINFTSEEGYHGLAINEFNVNIQGNGKATFVPDKPGTYEIHCNIFCGIGHNDMHATLVVQ